ncbi:hypothetical protein XM38_020420 [Halomicronema hongdechloris C2206]|uniref:Uncharacterized protein n=1 Tax=Halomicronema hongdechloris C2206 TaxID=1641165 RepID=A0A1Z3HL93_9CYAN|nr:nucleotidyltransferase domain-containing protein [Halomicronema hongdechloris]ASC71092.1 hypothetical protein XM38_020420 [Halomicronema hongdechloris C2206]
MLTANLDNQSHWLRGCEVAEAAARFLLEEFSVPKVVLFGSLLHPSIVRQHSDIDLAVWGLTDEQYDRALGALADLTSEFCFDLVQGESAQPSLSQVIERDGIALGYSSAPVVTQLSRALPLEHLPMKRTYAVLRGQLEQELQELEGLVQKTEALLAKLRATQDEDYLGTVALNLHSFYSGVERIFKQIAQTIDGVVPDTANWHRQLLRQMAAPVWHIRPAVLRADTVTWLEDYCSFRHLVRNIYSTHLKVDRVEALAERLPTCMAFLREDLEHMMIALESQPPWESNGEET